jgi:hypothetical protein
MTELHAFASLTAQAAARLITGASAGDATPYALVTFIRHTELLATFYQA